MEKQKRSILGNEEITWHARTSLPFPTKFTYHELHPDPSRKLERKLHEAENVIFDIVRNSTPSRIEELEIKHITGEK